MSLKFADGEIDLWGERQVSQGPYPGDERPDHERDRSRLIHSAAFRRLQNKTQVFGIGESDFYRTRLTHTMEVAQIGRGIVLQLEKLAPQYNEFLPKDAVVEAICFAHDLGHPPFGHSGEIALNWAMRQYGGFEGNGQSLRIVTKLEKHTERHGLNLIRRILLGILKYPCRHSRVCRHRYPSSQLLELPATEWEPPKCYLDCDRNVVDWVLEPLIDKDREQFEECQKERTVDAHGKPKYRSLDSSIMNIADDIAYGVHDLEDGIALNLIKREHLEKLSPELLDRVLAPLNKPASPIEWTRDILIEALFTPYPHTPTRKQGIGALIHALILSISIQDREQFVSPLLRLNAVLDKDTTALLKLFRDLNKKHIIDSQPVQTLELRGRKMIAEMFAAIMSDPERLLDEYHRDRLARDFATDGKAARIVCDYVASMSDTYATRFYERLFVPGEGSAFERL
ncbi:Deoxyguanosinetriphosphate triphosphohydrolase [Gemmata sp. SH-PL17]|uniref:anti-phage deoxyguanosine triphosphatase n=1 Tax=Gemmata sp. SH-PL17 TaxID=1630693 RepID=UPI00078D9E01|nr:anti-phage deoxyguanosine triphosphatase [Gemmata sp. SH-PL17]AMV24232.1 Deoxyguanosinetriphosphate triphosphohydrolase [Gemmata sp. SH-PL17]